MKPPPTISSFGTRMPNLPRTSLHCRRNIHIRAIVLSLSCQPWHDGSRRTIQKAESLKSWTIQAKRWRSTATAPASKSSYGKEAPPSAKTSKTNVPAKQTRSSNCTTAVSASATSRSPTPPATVTQSTQVPIVKAKENLNPPPFTYAPELTVPARKADQGFLSYIWKAGRSYLSFYKTGVSNVRQTSKLARTLREKATKAAPKNMTDVLTRAQWQIVQRSRKDMLRLPAFGLIFLVFGEWTPLLVMYITPIIPEACRIPSQVSRDLAKTEKVRHERLRVASSNAMSLLAKDRRAAGSAGTADSNAKSQSEAETVRETNPLQLTHYELFLASARYNCHSKFLDWLHMTPPKFWLQRNVRKKYEYLRTDDKLIGRDGGYQALEKGEVQRACIERGIDVLGKKEDEMRKSLAIWYRGGSMSR